MALRNVNFVLFQFESYYLYNRKEYKHVYSVGFGCHDATVLGQFLYIAFNLGMSSDYICEAVRLMMGTWSVSQMMEEIIWSFVE
jgi:hypothetical protein